MTHNISELSAHWLRFLIWGVLLMALGMVAIAGATLTTIFTVIFLGTLILATGILMLFDTLHFWRGKGSHFFLHILIALLYILVGVICLIGPIPASISLTFILAIFFILLGIFRIVFSLTYRFLGWKWSLVSGILSLLLGGFILANWPLSGLFIIGLFVGIDLMIMGWYYIMMSLITKTAKI